MINKREEIPVRIAERFRGGEGDIWIKDLTCGRKPANVKVFSEMVLPKGSSIGYHVHTADSEIIYILGGEGLYRTGETQVKVRAGDALVCHTGEGHGLRNEEDEPLRFLAAVVAE